MRIKLKDIAERANVSTATVSRVLNNNPNVDERTRDLVLRALNEVGYPSSGIRKPPEISKSISVILQSPDRGTSYIGTIIDGIETVVRQHGLPINLLRVTLDDPAPEELEQLKQTDSAIIVGGAVLPRIFDILEQEKIPHVLAAAHLGEREVNCVHGDYLRATSQAVQTLAGLGHRRIALVNGPLLTTTSLDKLAGYKLGLIEAGLIYDETLLANAQNFEASASQSVTGQLWARTSGFSAIFYATDTMAIGGLLALKELGLEIPRAVSVVGFYDEPFAPFMDPSLSSINIDWRRIGEIAALRLIALLEQHDEEQLRIIIPARLVMRNSIASYTL